MAYNANLMTTYFIRHTENLDIDQVTLQKLWKEHRIAIGYPQNKQNHLRTATRCIFLIHKELKYS